MEGAGTILLKVDETGYSFIGLKKASDDPATGEETRPTLKIIQLSKGPDDFRMDGTGESVTETNFKWGNDPVQIIKSTHEFDFSLEWHRGSNNNPDTVVLKLSDHDGGNPATMHFQRLSPSS